MPYILGEHSSGSHISSLSRTKILKYPRGSFGRVLSLIQLILIAMTWLTFLGLSIISITLAAPAPNDLVAPSTATATSCEPGTTLCIDYTNSCGIGYGG
jgi:hypothetical protein